jgi:putative ABC transport system permease protein
MARAQSRQQSMPRLQFSIFPRMSLGESLWIALSSLRANLLRTILTMLGIIIGVASVVALIAIGNGANASITERITSSGSNLLTVQPGQAGGFGRASVQAQSLTVADAEALAELPGIAAIAPAFQGNAQIVAGSNNTNAQVLGTTVDYFGIRNLEVEAGQLLSEAHIDEMSDVAVIGHSIAETLFGNATRAPGQTVRLGGSMFQVIGVLKERGQSPGGNIDQQVFVPLRVAQLKLFGARLAGSASLRVSNISIQVADAEQIPAVSALISATMRDRHNLRADGSADDFNVFNQADILETLNETTAILTAFLGAIAGISLFVGGIGVMNIMLVSVTERTREIGLRKAVGARRSDILQQFLIEALVVSIFGGILGVLVGLGVASLVRMTGLLTPVVSLGSIALAMGCSLAVGVFFGLYPAQRAARLRPIEALRYD